MHEVKERPPKDKIPSDIPRIKIAFETKSGKRTQPANSSKCVTWWFLNTAPSILYYAKHHVIRHNWQIDMASFLAGKLTGHKKARRSIIHAETRCSQNTLEKLWINYNCLEHIPHQCTKETVTMLVCTWMSKMTYLCYCSSWNRHK